MKQSSTAETPPRSLYRIQTEEGPVLASTPKADRNATRRACLYHGRLCRGTTCPPIQTPTHDCTRTRRHADTRKGTRSIGTGSRDNVMCGEAHRCPSCSSRGYSSWRTPRETTDPMALPPSSGALAAQPHHITSHQVTSPQVESTMFSALRRGVEASRPSPHRILDMLNVAQRGIVARVSLHHASNLDISQKPRDTQSRQLTYPVFEPRQADISRKNSCNSGTLSPTE